MTDTGAPAWAVRGPRPWTLLIGLPLVLSLLVPAVADAEPGPRSPVTWSLAGAAAGLFTAAVLTRYRRGAGRLGAVLLGLLAVLAVTATAVYSPLWWTTFDLLAIGIGTVLVHRRAPYLILAVTAVATVVVLLAGGTGDLALTTALTVGIAGLGTYAAHQLFAVVIELRCAQQELARLAVVQERERFGRDLHDLLGHTLSVIVVKAEAVRRLAPIDAGAAAVHAGDIETIGREALTDIRRAADGYRGAGLERELVRAGAALEAAGVRLELARPPAGGALPEDVDVLLGWVVREGVTNVVRHARATFCRIDVERAGPMVRLTIDDDGRGGQPRAGSRFTDDDPDADQGDVPGDEHGSGLLGLRERLAGAGGTVEVGPSSSGFRVRAEVPSHPVATASR